VVATDSGRISLFFVSFFFVVARREECCGRICSRIITSDIDVQYVYTRPVLVRANPPKFFF
jgi:hypothetical protein